MRGIFGVLLGLVLAASVVDAQDLFTEGESSSGSGSSRGPSVIDVVKQDSPTSSGGSPSGSRVRARSVYAQKGSFGINPSPESPLEEDSKVYTPLNLWGDIQHGNINDILSGVPRLETLKHNKAAEDDITRQRDRFYESVTDHIIDLGEGHDLKEVLALNGPLLRAIFPEKDPPGFDMNLLISRASKDLRRQLFGKTAGGESSQDPLRELPLEHQRMLAVFHDQYNTSDDWSPMLYIHMELLVDFRNPFIMIEIIYRHLKNMSADPEEESVGITKKEYRDLLIRLLQLTCREERDPDQLMEGFLASFYLVARGFGTERALGKREGFPRSKSVAFSIYARMSGVSYDDINQEVKNTTEDRKKMVELLMNASKYISDYGEEKLKENFPTLRWLLLFNFRAARSYQKSLGCKKIDEQKSLELYGEYLTLITTHNTTHNQTSTPKITALKI